MKKLGLLGLFAACAIALTACQETSERSDANLVNKIQNHEALTAEDYSRLIEYTGAYAEKAQPFVDMLINDQEAEGQAGLDKLNAEYPDIDLFRNCLKRTPASKLSENDLQEVAKYAGYIEFSAPVGYEIVTNPDAAGLEVAAPATDNGVVAGAVDEVKVKED